MKFFISSFIEKANFDFARYRKLSLFISITLILITFLLVIIKGINFGVDFNGGLVFEIKSNQKIDLDVIKLQLIENKNLNTPTLHYLQDNKNALIKIKSQDNDKDIQTVKAALKKYQFTYQKIDYVGPQVSQILITKGIISVILALFGIFIYLTFRFNYKFGIGGVLSLVHDVIIIFGIYSLFSLEFSTSSIVAILTIIGYSINDSVVIFDKIRESSRKIKNKYQLINLSINSTLSRTTLTSFTTILAILPIILVSSGEVKDFATIILSGVIVGTYSSIFISAPITLLGVKGDK
jgi:preprotein translocase subunit SecF